MRTRLPTLALLLLSACHRGHDFGWGDPCGPDKHPDPGQPPGEPGPRGRTPVPPGGSGGSHGGAGGSGGTGGATAAGSCTTDAMCGGGLVCDRTLGACARPRGGCGTAAFQPVRTTGEVVLVLDRSNSMREPTPTGNKWSDLTSSINSVLSRRGDVTWGLDLFPASDTRACVPGSIGITPAMTSSGAIAGAIAATSPTGSGTPTRDTVQLAGRQILGAGRPTRKYLLLATDGEPNCSPDAADPSAPDVDGTATAIRGLAAEGMTTFVLGVAVQSASAAALTAMAQAGGHARQGMTAYFTAGDATELERALDEVARQIALCTFDLTPPPPAGATLALSIGGRTFSRNTNHVGDGWDVTAAGKAIELYGAACDAVQAGGLIQVSYGCGAGTRCDDSAMACVPAGLP
jgi:hypothetical protein